MYVNLLDLDGRYLHYMDRLTLIRSLGRLEYYALLSLDLLLKLKMAQHYVAYAGSGQMIV